MRADSGGTALARTPGRQDAAHFGQHPLQVGRLLLQQRADVQARCSAIASQRDDVLDLGKAEAQAASLPHEGQEPKDIGRVTPVASRRSARRRQDAARLVQADGLAADAAARGNLTDQQPVFHGRRVGLPPEARSSP
jgi:hypothetical protein